MSAVFVLAAFARAEPVRLTIEATDPEAGAVLRSGESLYVRYRVESATPVAVRAEGWSGGRPLPLSNSGIGALAAGGGVDGAFLFSNAHDAPVSMDELRLVATSADGREALATLSVPFKLTWDIIRPQTTRPRPDWVRLWSEARDKKSAAGIRAFNARSAASGAGAAAGLLMPVFGLLVLAVGVGGLALPIAALIRWRGAWRAAALLPALVFGFVLLRLVRDIAADSTSHNLWPLELLLTGAPSLLFLGALALARRFFAASDTKTTPTA